MKKKIIIPIVIVLVISLIAVFVSYSKFATINPISSLNGIIKISLTEKEYTVIQNRPYKVIVSKKKTGEKYAQLMLDEYMEEREYVEIDRAGSIITYSNGIDTETVDFSVNKYYSLWKWE